MRSSGRVYTPQFSAYSYTGALGAGAEYVPPAGTIVMIAHLGTVQDLDIMIGLALHKAGADLGATERGYIGCIVCDGADVKFKNTNVGPQQLILKGVTMA